jgi:ubiquinone/menaquinone biosynthesis C-methylase UbiE
MLPRVLEPEVMDTAAEAHDYDLMDHRQVNELFVTHFLLREPQLGTVLDVGTGTALIPIEVCWRHPKAQVVAVDMSKHMLARAEQNVRDSDFAGRIRVEMADAKQLPYADESFDAVMSNSIVHHSPEPRRVLEEMVRVCRRGGLMFVRDLLRPRDDTELQRLVDVYAADANDHQRQMFTDSLRAALTLQEVRDLVQGLGYPVLTMSQTSDRHWTWAARR